MLHKVQDDVILPQDLELFGVDWAALSELVLADSQLQNNTITENTSSWIGRRGPPDNLNEVMVEPPEGDLTVEDIGQLHTFISPWLPMLDHESLTQRWAQALAFSSTFILGNNHNDLEQVTSDTARMFQIHSTAGGLVA
ncbi:hypothetical protein BS47DRAFT_1357209 [Hydnum rufescens UP504]|uniref:Uncharacterized protein n=1 Tax=Hydnum rufescens UP504 TaxID=1448309 RepID=A0A9P6BB75_9AGAM|nr:hypothetical protein BS47DRAFT_1357209 [Hydnum rufescens UP504]